MKKILIYGIICLIIIGCVSALSWNDLSRNILKLPTPTPTIKVTPTPTVKVLVTPTPVINKPFPISTPTPIIPTPTPIPIVDWTKDIDLLKGNIVTLQNKDNEIDTRITVQTERINALYENNENLQSQIDTNQVAITSVSNDNIITKNDLSYALQEIYNLKKQLCEINKEYKFCEGII